MDFALAAGLPVLYFSPAGFGAVFSQKCNNRKGVVKVADAILPGGRAMTPTRKARISIIFATLLALLLGALDTLAMGAAMPTIVSELGGLHLYSWVFSAYMLARAVSLPIFGKLCDLFANRTLFSISILIFLAGSVMAGVSASMVQLTASRVIQGIGAGGVFALTYIVLSDISTPEKRGKMMSLASFVWGLASVLGPSFGGFLVSVASWRWIFFINLPLGGLSLLGLRLFLTETREKRSRARIDYRGALLLSTAILSLLGAFLLAGRNYAWFSPEIGGLLLLFLASFSAFIAAERRAPEPILPIEFFRVAGFSLGNGAVFFSSVAIFCVAAYSPLFIQGALGHTPMELGLAMISLSMGWSAGALLCGQLVHRLRERPAAILGGCFLVAGTGLAATFTAQTELLACSVALGLAGIGMGFVSISTLLIVQNSVGPSHLGVATSSHQFTRSLGGTIGIGICGGLVTARFLEKVEGRLGAEAVAAIPPDLWVRIRENFENLFRPEVQERLSDGVRAAMQSAIGESILLVFWFTLAAAVVCLGVGMFLPESGTRQYDLG
jgi:EmrB/QacA subfamily drug resistance transporter